MSSDRGEATMVNQLQLACHVSRCVCVQRVSQFFFSFFSVSFSRSVLSVFISICLLCRMSVVLRFACLCLVCCLRSFSTFRLAFFVLDFSQSNNRIEQQKSHKLYSMQAIFTAISCTQCAHYYTFIGIKRFALLFLLRSLALSCSSCRIVFDNFLVVRRLPLERSFIVCQHFSFFRRSVSIIFFFLSLRCECVLCRKRFRNNFHICFCFLFFVFLLSSPVIISFNDFCASKSMRNEIRHKSIGRQFR